MKTEVKQILGKQVVGAVVKQAAPHQNNPASMLIMVFEDDTTYEFYTSEGWLRPHQLWLMNDLQQLREWGEDQMETLMIGWLDDDGNPQLDYVAD